jgi:hypothetical protein
MTDPVPVPVERPKPLTTLATWLGPSLGVVGGLLAYLVTTGTVTQVQADTLNQAVGILGTVVSGSPSPAAAWTAAAAGLITAASTSGAVAVQARLSRQRVTPLSDPVDHDGMPLVRADTVALPRMPGPADYPDPAPPPVVRPSTSSTVAPSPAPTSPTPLHGRHEGEQL